jgi:hypothetical protein
MIKDGFKIKGPNATSATITSSNIDIKYPVSMLILATVTVYMWVIKVQIMWLMNRKL